MKKEKIKKIIKMCAMRLTKKIYKYKDIDTLIITDYPMNTYIEAKINNIDKKSTWVMTDIDNLFEFNKKFLLSLDQSNYKLKTLYIDLNIYDISKSKVNKLLDFISLYINRNLTQILFIDSNQGIKAKVLDVDELYYRLMILHELDYGSSLPFTKGRNITITMVPYSQYMYNIEL